MSGEKESANHLGGDSLRKSAEARRRILDRLRLELRRRRGGVRRAEAKLGKSPGYLAKVARGAFRIPLDVLLEALEILGVEPPSFFASALEAVTEPGDLLAELATLHSPDAGERRFLATARRIATDSPGTFQADANALSANVFSRTLAEILRGTPGQQRRRLKERRFHRPALLLAFLDHLDQRPDEPDADIGLAAAVVVSAAPRLTAGGHAVVLRALGVSGAAQCLRGHLDGAARSLALGLELAEPRSPAAGDLLRRAVPVLAKAEMPRHAHQLLRQALEIAVVHGAETLLEAVLLTRRDLLASHREP